MVTAKINREYALRLIGVGLMMVGICIWSIYDGTTAWPNVNKAMDAARPELLATNLSVTAWLERGDDGKAALDRVFAAQGHKTPSKLVKKLGELKLPEKLANDTAAREMQTQQVRLLFEHPVYSAHDIQTQWYQAGITLLLGLLAFGVVATKATRQFIADEQGLSGSGVGPRPLLYADLAAIDWSRWNDKGIVRLTDKTGATLTLDGWHFAGITKIVEVLQKQRPDLAERGEGTKDGAEEPAKS